MCYNVRTLEITSSGARQPTTQPHCGEIMETKTMYRSSQARASGSVRVSGALAVHLHLIDEAFDAERAADAWEGNLIDLPETEDVKANKLITRINNLPMLPRVHGTALSLLAELDRINLLLVSDNTLHRLATWAASVEGE